MNIILNILKSAEKNAVSVLQYFTMYTIAKAKKEKNVCIIYVKYECEL